MTGEITILTCSMQRDRALFALLARSIDECLDPPPRHRVIVPARELAGFAPFRTHRREIVAQEEVLPFRVWPLPAAAQRLAGVLPALRRPLYLDAGLRPLRGWLLQQVIKIAAACADTGRVVMHVDSDVMFLRPIPRAAVWAGDRLRLFRAGAQDAAPLHAAWSATATRLLGLPADAAGGWHYIENCVLWSPVVARAMVARIEAVTGGPWHAALRRERALSEYVLYGLFANCLPTPEPLVPGPVTPCLTLWHAEDPAAALAGVSDHLAPHHCAVGLQSTVPLAAAQREALWEAARARLPA